MENIIWAVIIFGMGWAAGRTVDPPEQPEQEIDKDFVYYKNLSESLLSDVRRLREEVRALRNND